MDPEKLVKSWSANITSEAGAQSSCPAQFPLEPLVPAESGLFDLIPDEVLAAGKPVAQPVAPVDEFQHYLTELGRVKPLVIRLSGHAYEGVVTPAWEHYQKTKDPAAFIKVVKKLVNFDRLVRRVYRLLPTFRLNSHPRTAELAKGLQENALVDDKVRHEWQELADLCWREFIQRAGPFGREIAEEIP